MERIAFEEIARKIREVEARRGEPIDLDRLLDPTAWHPAQRLSDAAPPPEAGHTSP